MIEDFSSRRFWASQAGRPLLAAYLALAVAIIAAYFLVSASVGDIIYPSGGLLSAAVIFESVRRYRPAHHWGWLLFGAGIALFAVADIIYYGWMSIHGSVPFPFWSDGVYFLGYFFIAAGLLAMVPRQRGRARLLALIDSATFTTAIGIYDWMFIIRPSAQTAHEASLAQMISAAYPLMDILLLALVVRMSLSGGFANRSLRLLGGSMAFLLLADSFY